MFTAVPDIRIISQDNALSNVTEYKLYDQGSFVSWDRDSSLFHHSILAVRPTQCSHRWVWNNLIFC